MTPGKAPERPSAGDGGPRNFIRDIIDADRAAGKHGGRVVTRFPPEPNGYLHIGHAKSICLNFGIAADYGGTCHLRFDDTNPTTEDVSFVRAIEADVRWLGFRWDGPVRYASDYFDQMYAWAEHLVQRGRAYVDSLTPDELRELRGTPYEPGRNSPWRDRPVAENLDLLRRMKAGEFPAGTHVLRAKIDMGSPNILMRDPPLYRVLHAHHHRTGDAWCLYPMYDYAHCLEDSIEGITHSLCTLEFEINRELYDWVLESVEAPHRPQQIEFARLNLGYTVLSKRYLKRLVAEGHVAGWDDPRMPTVAGLRRRGVPPEAIRDFCTLVGVAKTDSLVDVGKLEYCIRDALNTTAPRVLGVLRPLKLVVTTWPAGKTDELDAPYWPEDIGKPGSRTLPFTRELLVERDDFSADPPKGWHRLAPGREVRLRYGYIVRCDEVVRDGAGEVVELRCSHDPASRGGTAADGRKVPGTIHWVSAAHAVPAEVRLYDRLFTRERPGAESEDFVDDLNPESLVVLAGARVEPSLAAAEPGSRWQLERLGYFVADEHDSRPGKLVLNRIVTLRDSWAKRVEAEAGGAGAGARAGAAAGAGSGVRSGSATAAATGSGVAPGKPGARATGGSAPGAGPAPTPGTVSPERERARAASPDLAARFGRYRDELGLAEQEADVLTGDRALADFFEAAAAGHEPRSVARWLVNDVLGALGERPLAELPFDGAALGRLVGLVDGDRISTPAAKQVLAEMMERGGDPAAIVKAKRLAKVSDDDALGAAIDAALAAHPDELLRYRAGESKLVAFFMGAVMRATRGAADPQKVQELLREKLG